MTNQLRDIAVGLGLSFLKQRTQAKTIEDISMVTCSAINLWMHRELGLPEVELPFNDLPGSKKLGGNWEVVDWNVDRKFFQVQDEFYLVQRSTGREWRWINGRTQPMEKQRVNTRKIG